MMGFGDTTINICQGPCGHLNPLNIFLLDSGARPEGRENRLDLSQQVTTSSISDHV